MASTYGVSYGGGKKAPTRYGTTSYVNAPGQTKQSMSSLMRPMSSAQPVSDVLNSAQIAAQNKLSAIAPTPAASFSGYGGQSPDDRSGGAAAASPYSAPTAPTGAPAGTDLSADPILNQIKALGRRSAQDASSNALATAKAQLVNYGATSLPSSLSDLFTNATPTSDPLLGDVGANPILGALNDSGTAQAAAANPYSTLKQLSGAHDSNVHNLDNASNLNNLFYSSTHANQLGDENTNYLGSQNNAAQSLASLLSGDNSGVLSAIDSAHQQYLGALPDAYSRSLAAAAAAGSDGGVGSATPTDPNAAPVDPASLPNAGLTTSTGLSPAELYRLLQQGGASGGVRPSTSG